jgi:tetratricopeptide (TPR) repeat protein
MGATDDRDRWIEDFSIVLTPRAIRRLRSDPALDLLTSPKWLVALWLGVIACIAGALGGLLVSGTLWSSLVYPPIWLAAVVAICWIVGKATMRLLGGSVGFLAGWSIFWGMFAGAVAMWGAQLSTAGWAYGVAGGVGFLIGVIEGNLENADIEDHDTWMLIGAVLAPASICLAVWLHRHGLIGPAGFAQAGITGMIAGAVFMAPVMALYIAKWNNRRALLRLAALYLHCDQFIAEAIPLLDRAIDLSPGDADLLDRRALAHALAGDMASAEADWARHRSISKRSRAPKLAMGWLHLRRGQPDLAVDAFDRALNGRAQPSSAVIGKAVAHLRLNQPQPAIALLGGLSDDRRESRDTTYLAQAYLMQGDLGGAMEWATVAIDEMDSVHGLSWLIRADVQAALGKTDWAIADLNRALAADDEEGVEQRALDGLERLNGDVLEEDELEDLEKRLDSVDMADQTAPG